jgi:hypothetical protein
MEQRPAFPEGMARVHKTMPFPEPFDFRDPAHVGAMTTEVVLNTMLDTPELSGLWRRVGRPGPLPPSAAVPDVPAVLLLDDRVTPSWLIVAWLQRAGVAQLDAYRALTALLRKGEARVPVSNPTAAAAALAEAARGENSGLRVRAES